MGYKSFFALSALILISIFFLSGCGSQIAFKKIERPPYEPSFNEVFGSIKPSLVVRNTGCITCHSQIHGDLVTDLGKGDSFFLGADSPSNHPGQPNYGPMRSQRFIWHPGAWKSTALFGDIYIPDAIINDSQLLSAYTAVPGQQIPQGGLKLIDFANGRFVHPDETTGNPTELIGKTTSPNPATPGLRGQFISRQIMNISAPTETRIRDLTQIRGTVAVASQGDTSIFRAPRTSVSGFRIDTGNANRPFVTNGESVSCYGDVIVQGTLFLKNLRLVTDGKGCRLYVSGTVFVQGPIEYVGGDAGGQNLQISSARAISFGMWSMKTRFGVDATPAMLTGLRTHMTDSMEQSFNQRIISDRDRMVGLTDDAGPIRVMKDTATQEILAFEETFDLHNWRPAPGRTTFPNPSTCSETGPCTLTWANEFQRKTVNYSHLILNAPVIHGRYFGNIKGALIAEKVLMAVGNLKFEADTSLGDAPFLPLIGSEVFGISPE